MSACIVETIYWSADLAAIRADFPNETAGKSDREVLEEAFDSLRGERQYFMSTDAEMDVTL